MYIFKHLQLSPSSHLKSKLLLGFGPKNLVFKSSIVFIFPAPFSDVTF